MQTGTLLTPTVPIPDRWGESIRTHFPGQELSELTIRYYNDVEDVGYEYFTETVLPGCPNSAAIQYIAPFISFVRLGEALILEQGGLVVYETDGHDRFTETGPLWIVLPQTT